MKFQTASDMLEKLEAGSSKLTSDEEKLYKMIHSFGDDELRQQILNNLIAEEGDQPDSVKIFK